MGVCRNRLFEIQEGILACQAAVGLGGGLEGFFGGVALVVGASGYDVLWGGVTILEADKAKAEHGVGKAGTDEGEGAGLALVGRQERWGDDGEVAGREGLYLDAEVELVGPVLMHENLLVQDVEQQRELLCLLLGEVGEQGRLAVHLVQLVADGG